MGCNHDNGCGCNTPIEISKGDTGTPGSPGIDGGDGGDGTNGIDGIDGRGYDATSSNELTIPGIGGTITAQIETEKAYTVGARVRFTDKLNPTLNFFEGIVTAYNPTTGDIELTASVDLFEGSGIHSIWDVNLAGEPGVNGSNGSPGTPGAPGAPGSTIIDTNHTALTTLINTNALVPGAYYRFSYQTIHHIEGTTAVYNNTTAVHDDGSLVATTFTPEIETVLAFAVSASDINVEIYSTQYPNDVIYYDVKDILTEDGLVDRPGFITYREDTVLNLSSHYDFRNVLHRRYELEAGLDRSVEWDAYLDKTGLTDFDSLYIQSVPFVVPFVDGGNTNIGGWITPGSTDARDYLTFVALGNTTLFGADGPEYKNIKIGNTGDAPIQSGSGLGAVLRDPTGNLTISNVVIFARAAENIEVGNNANGVTLVSHTLKSIKIGNDARNVAIGGNQGGVIGIAPVGFANNVTIGDNNTDISLSDHIGEMNIGSSNLGILKGAQSYNVDIGSNNTTIYIDGANQLEIKDWNTLIFLQNPTHFTIEYANENIRAYTFPEAETHTHSTPTGIIETALVSSYGNSGNRIGSDCENIYIGNFKGIHFGNNVLNCSMFSSNDVTIGTDCYDIDLEYSYLVNIGQASFNLEIWGSNNLTIGASGHNQIINGAIGGTIGKGCNHIFTYRSNDCVVGDYSDYIHLMTSNGSVVGSECSDIHLRNCEENVLGSNVIDVFSEGTETCTIGNDSTAITLSNTGIRYKFDFTSVWGLSLVFTDKTLRPVTGKTYQTDFLGILLQPISEMAPAYTGDVNPLTSNNTTIGNNCSEVSIIGSTGCTIGNDSTSVAIGTEVLSTVVYTETYTCGLAGPCPRDYLAINTDVVFQGVRCNDTVIGNNCDVIKVTGSDNNLTVVGDNSINIEINGDTNTNNVFGDNIDNIEIIGSGNHLNNFGDKCTIISIQGDISNGNTIGNGCTGFSLVGNNNSLNTIGDNCITFTITGSDNQRNVFGNNCVSVIIIGNDNSNSSIGSYSRNVEVTGSSNLQLSVGAGSDSIDLIGDGNEKITVGDSCTSFAITGSTNTNVSVGAKSDAITIIGDSNTFISVGSNCILLQLTGNLNSLISLGNSCTGTQVIGSSNGGITFGDSAGSCNVIGDTNTRNSFGYSAQSCSIQGNLNTFNVFEEACNDSTIVGNSNTANSFGVRSQFVDITGDSNVSNAFGADCFSITMTGSGNERNTFGNGVNVVTTNALFLLTDSKVLVRGNAVILSGTITNKIYDKADSAGDRWATPIDTFGLPLAPVKLV